MSSVYDLKTKSEMVAFLCELRRSMCDTINSVNHVIEYLQFSMRKNQSIKYRIISWVIKSLERFNEKP